MDRDKLNKAAEEYASAYIIPPDFLPAECVEGFEEGADWLMRQSLSDRLTDEEKVRIRGYYDNPGFSKFAREIADGLLVSIFGRELFEEE